MNAFKVRMEMSSPVEVGPEQTIPQPGKTNLQTPRSAGGNRKLTGTEYRSETPQLPPSSTTNQVTGLKATG